MDQDYGRRRSSRSILGNALLSPIGLNKLDDKAMSSKTSVRSVPAFGKQIKNFKGAVHPHSGMIRHLNQREAMTPDKLPRRRDFSQDSVELLIESDQEQPKLMKR